MGKKGIIVFFPYSWRLIYRGPFQQTVLWIFIQITKHSPLFWVPSHHFSLLREAASFRCFDLLLLSQLPHHLFSHRRVCPWHKTICRQLQEKLLSVDENKKKREIAQINSIGKEKALTLQIQKGFKVHRRVVWPYWSNNLKF